MTRRNAKAPRRGFTLMEIIVVMMLIALLATMGYPAIQNSIRRSRLTSISTEITSGLRLARYQAIKTSRPTVYSIDPVTGRILSWVDDNDDGLLDLAEDVLIRANLSAGVFVRKPPTATGGPIVGFDGTNMARFNGDGSIDAVGAYRFADDPDADQARNFIEIGLRPRSVARVEVKKWDGADWWAQDEGMHPWVWY